ncbi:MAG: zinc ABC transporter ATP-binding protein ZnuC [Rhodospirillales bacterium]|nr:zinc ABC transporter ATP-binding protein ZnuC [Rhodospirillales bacterium]MCW8862696.1 zinc ABC transporter ATP-binding protein ZnuC [Rhodospirillales bacterium]MCW8953026.1 zinc ABC transporter ATP-binding protein ZnuC [Rhodospirillales bacterium]
MSERDADVLLEVRDAHLSFAGREVLNGVGLSVSPGRIVSVIGPNGAGKTTLIRVALGLVVPEKGSVYRRKNLRIGYMPQRLEIDRSLPLTVRRFMMLGGAREEEDIRRVLGETRIAELADKPVQDVSGGEMQRILLARALLRNPDILVLDEPAQGVDVTGQSELYGLIERIKDRRGCGVLLVSHDLHLVMGATDEVICLNGHICCEGHPEAVSRHPEYIALFGPKVADNLAVYHHDHDHAHGLHGEVVALEPGKGSTGAGNAGKGEGNG